MSECIVSGRKGADGKDGKDGKDGQSSGVTFSSMTVAASETASVTGNSSNYPVAIYRFNKAGFATVPAFRVTTPSTQINVTLIEFIYYASTSFSNAQMVNLGSICRYNDPAGTYSTPAVRIMVPPSASDVFVGLTGLPTSPATTSANLRNATLYYF